MPRLGIERVRAVLLDDSDGMVAELDAGIQAAVDAYVDPWKERARPATPGQFRSSLPLVALPLVPAQPTGAPGGTPVSIDLTRHRRASAGAELAGQQ